MVEVLGLDVDMHIGKVRVDTAGDIHCDGIDDIAVESIRILGDRDGVHIRDEQESLVLVLVVYDLADAAAVVTYGECARRLKSC